MEDFVPYELAVKLEQKGFKQGYNTFGYRPIFSDETTIRFISEIGAYEKEYFGENIAAPTIAQALKWLREEKMIHICVSYSDNIGVMWEYEVIILEGALYENAGSAYVSYEQAALAGIEYVLDNVI